MKETEFKALMYGEMYVDGDLLTKGIYPTSLPRIYPKDETIEKLIERGRQAKDMSGVCFVPESYFENLKQCEMVKVTVNLI